MCGFLTYISSCGDASTHVRAVTEGIERLHHRGPDQTGVQVAGDDAVLGFKRLSIIDVEHSDQPLVYGDRYVITFNGEIYNYLELREQLVAEHGAVFTTDGDTEVLVAAYHHWGTDALRRLRGMFAFVIWDKLERVAFGARDRFGIKPLCYALGATGAYFASEPKALPAADRPLDRTALSHYLTYQYVPEPYSLHSGVYQLGAGECFAYTAEGDLGRHHYWRPRLHTRREPAATVEARIRDALSNSVAAHLRADVPVGAFLSSGIDSAAVVALAQLHNPDIQTFTASLDVGGYSELEVAQQTAASLGVPNTAVVVTADMMMDALPGIVWHLDDPVADPALVPLYFVAREAAKHVKVVLSGEGADELFAGYGNYREARSLRVLTSLPQQVRRGLGAVAEVIPEGVRGRSFLQRGSVSIEERYYGNARMFTEEEKRALMRHYDPTVRYTDITAPLYARAADLDDVQKMQFIDLGTWLPGDILRKADRMTMAHSLEARVPFLDPEVFEAAAGIPT
jgi:asparagine synthase (glutamine-hydrolysing)